MKKILVFDLDNTLAISKSPIDLQMAEILDKLLDKIKIGIISGGDFPQFHKQVIPYLKGNLENLYILPTSGTKFYQYRNDEWQKLYSDDFTIEEKKRIFEAFRIALKHTSYKPEVQYGELIEDRGTQITFSALGQDAPAEIKKDWDKTFVKRTPIKLILDQYLKDFSISMNGSTSIDITKKGIDKGYGMTKLMEILNLNKEEIAFYGDALQEGGNDYAVRRTGVECIEVNNPEDTKRLLQEFIANS